MRLAGYNTSRLNAEPMNGMGIYAAQKVFSPSWMLAVTMAAKTFSSSWGVRAFAAKAMSTSWNMIGRAGKTFSIPFDVCVSVGKSLSVSWGVRQIAAALQLAEWNIRERINPSLLPAGWGVREYVTETHFTAWGVRIVAAEVYSPIWHVTSGLVAGKHFRWRLPMIMKNRSSSLQGHGSGGRLIRHTNTNPIIEG